MDLLLNSSKSKEASSFSIGIGQSFLQSGIPISIKADTVSKTLPPFLDFPSDIRKAIYTTNALEAINRQIKKIVKAKGAFPHDQAVFKLVFLVLQNASKKWTMPIREWKLALNQFAILYSDRDL
ncbi:transposase [Candidatus Bealeia paramacronuclearis]|uniref:transposase n=1 Tax=Candidatus Bealeia paramacronuclearis TaxID=1921001 RepID=UPI002F26A653